MENLITEIPACPDSVSTAEARELFMDLCEEKIQQKRLTPEMLEAIKGYCFLTQISGVAEKEIRKSHSSFSWHDVWMACVKRESEYSEKLGLTPFDRKDLGLM